MSVPCKVEVAGISNLSKYPDRGTLNIDVKATGFSQAEVAKTVRSTMESISEKFKELHDTSSPSTSAITYWTLNSMQTRSWVHHGNSMAVVDDDGEIKDTMKYEATNSAEVVFRDFKKLSEVAHALSLTKNVSVSSTKWLLLDKTEQSLLGESCKTAYKDALIKAQAYAEVAGMVTVRPVKIVHGAGLQDDKKNMMLQLQQQQQQQHMIMQMQQQPASAAKTTASAGLFLTPQHIKKTAKCSVEFEIS